MKSCSFRRNSFFFPLKNTNGSRYRVTAVSPRTDLPHLSPTSRSLFVLSSWRRDLPFLLARSRRPQPPPQILIREEIRREAPTMSFLSSSFILCSLASWAFILLPSPGLNTRNLWPWYLIFCTLSGKTVNTGVNRWGCTQSVQDLILFIWSIFIFKCYKDIAHITLI